MGEGSVQCDSSASLSLINVLSLGPGVKPSHLGMVKFTQIVSQVQFLEILGPGSLFPIDYHSGFALGSRNLYGFPMWPYQEVGSHHLHSKFPWMSHSPTSAREVGCI